MIDVLQLQKRFGCVLAVESIDGGEYGTDGVIVHA